MHSLTFLRPSMNWMLSGQIHITGPKFFCLCKQCRSISVGLKKPTDLDLHCLLFSIWIFINKLDQVIWLAENYDWGWHLNLFCRTRFKVLERRYTWFLFWLLVIHYLFYIMCRSHYLFYIICRSHYLFFLLCRSHCFTCLLCLIFLSSVYEEPHSLICSFLFFFFFFINYYSNIWNA